MDAVGEHVGFTPLPGTYVVFLLSTSAAYLALVEAAKRRLVHGAAMPN